MAQQRPNLIFVFPDQLGAHWLGCYGSPLAHTPHLDALAATSCVFTQAYTSSPLCTPYRACLLTGRYPSQTGVTENGMALPCSERTLAQALNAAGYHTAYVGKWHLSGEPQGKRWVPPDQRGGFQTFIGWESHHVDHWDGRIWADDPEQPLPMPGHETDALTDIAIDQMNKLVDGPPFALFVAYQSPHPPCSPPAAYEQRYRQGDLAPEPNVDRRAYYDHPGWDAIYDLQTFRRRYLGEVSHIDAAVGRLLAAIDASDGRDNTLLVFTSDHGELAGAHGLFGKEVMYQESVQVPLLVRLPGQQERRSLDVPVSTVDLMPTLLDLVGAKAEPGAMGRSLAPSLRGSVVQHAEPLFIEYRERCVLADGFKLVMDHPLRQALELYDLAADPFELHNLVADASLSAQCAQLEAALRQWSDGL